MASKRGTKKNSHAVALGRLGGAKKNPDKGFGSANASAIAKLGLATRWSPTLTNKRVAVYLHCASRDQSQRESPSITVQRELCKQFSEAQGHTVVAEYVDDGYPGGSADRPGLNAALAKFQSGETDAILVVSHDRISRSLETVLDVNQQARFIFANAGVQNQRTNDAYTELFASLRSAVADYETAIEKKQRSATRETRLRAKEVAS